MFDLRTKDERMALSEENGHYLGRPCKRGHTTPEGKTWRDSARACPICKRLNAVAWRTNNPERARANTAKRDEARDNSHRRRQWPFALTIGAVRKRARDADIPVTLTVDEAKVIWRDQGGKCFWTGRDMDFFIGKARHPLRPSLDRIDPAKGYTAENVVWSSNFANRARGELPAPEFASLMSAMGFSGPYVKKWSS